MIGANKFSVFTPTAAQVSARMRTDALSDGKGSIMANQEQLSPTYCNRANKINI